MVKVGKQKIFYGYKKYRGGATYFSCCISPQRASALSIESGKVAIPRADVDQIGGDHRCCQYLCSSGVAPEKLTFSGIQTMHGTAIVTNIEIALSQSHTAN